VREIVLDTETTGFDPAAGHRVVEIGCVELVNHVPTGQSYQTYLNPEREMPDDAFAVHGLGTEFLAEKPLFAAIIDDFLAFIGEAPLVIHNAEFDLKFLNAELARLDRPALPLERAIDTVGLARRKFPGQPASLDALCRRFNVDASARDKHGALLDAELLAQVYLELTGGRQPGLGLAVEATVEGSAGERRERPPRPHEPSAEEVEAHSRFVDGLENPIWKQ
jgi:DNA polymerase-3 subunit epsilon